VPVSGIPFSCLKADAGKVPASGGAIIVGLVELIKNFNILKTILTVPFAVFSGRRLVSRWPKKVQ
jgi:hypothetical protein